MVLVSILFCHLRQGLGCLRRCVLFFSSSLCCWNGRPCPAVQQRYSVLLLFNSRAHSLRVRAGYVRAQPLFPSSPPPSPLFFRPPSPLPPTSLPHLTYHRIASHRIAHHSSFSRLQFIKIYNDLFFGFFIIINAFDLAMANGRTHPSSALRRDATLGILLVFDLCI